MIDNLIEYSKYEILHKLSKGNPTIKVIETQNLSFCIYFNYREEEFVISFDIENDFSLLHLISPDEKINIFEVLHPFDKTTADLDYYYNWRDQLPNFSNSESLCAYLVENLEKYMQKAKLEN